jgi:hypothetical protein
MAVLGRTEILANYRKLPTEDVPVPEWGDGATVRVRGLTAAGRDRFEATYLVRLGPDGKPLAGFMPDSFRAPLVALCAVDGDGNPLFRESDITALAECDGRVIDRLYQVAARLSGMEREAVEDAKKG